MNAVTDLNSDLKDTVGEPLILRVLLGRSQGAEHRLPANRRLLVGHSFENDIVLRDPSTRGFSLELTTCGQRAVIKVVAGNAAILGRKFVANERITLERYIPVRLGDIVFAVGGADEVRWDEVAATLEEDERSVLSLSEEAPRTDLAERVNLQSQSLRRRYSALFMRPRFLAIAGGALVAIAAGALFGNSIVNPAPPTRGQIATQLLDQGYSGLSVEPIDQSGQFAVVGLVADETALLKLRQWAEDSYPNLAIGVTTIDGAAEAASNLLAAQNVDAAVVPNGATSLLIETPFLPQDRQQELATLLRNDLPRVSTFTFNASPDRGEQDLAYFFNAPGYGAASFVSGDPGFIVTEDGTRWFVGASLPTGHTIVEITDSRVTVERHGLRDTLIM